MLLFLQAQCMPCTTLLGYLGYDTSDLEKERDATAVLSTLFPDTEKITNRHVLLFAGLVALADHLSAFLYFGVSSFQKRMNSEFLSLDSTAGICETVTLSRTQTYYVDKYGAWDQDESFRSQEALFVVKFTGYRGDDTTWASDMDALYKVINANGVPALDLEPPFENFAPDLMAQDHRCFHSWLHSSLVQCRPCLHLRHSWCPAEFIYWHTWK